MPESTIQVILKPLDDELAKMGDVIKRLREINKQFQEILGDRGKTGTFTCSSCNHEWPRKDMHGATGICWSCADAMADYGDAYDNDAEEE